MTLEEKELLGRTVRRLCSAMHCETPKMTFGTLHWIPARAVGHENTWVAEVGRGGFRSWFFWPHFGVRYRAEVGADMIWRSGYSRVEVEYSKSCVTGSRMDLAL
jgi:hypothetical protein